MKLGPAQYCLHASGMIYICPNGGFGEPLDYIKKCWYVNDVKVNSYVFYEWLKECLELGAKKARVLELAEENHLGEFVTGSIEELKNYE